MFVSLDSEQLYLLNMLANESGHTFDEILNICINIGIKRLSNIHDQTKSFVDWYINAVTEYERKNGSE